jgi:hypothetical protein
MVLLASPRGEQKATTSQTQTSQPRRPSCMEMGFALLGNPGQPGILGNSGKNWAFLHAWFIHALSIRIDHDLSTNEGLS